MTRKQREEACLAFVCPACHAEAGQVCRREGYRLIYMRTRMPGKPMKGVHIERLAKVQP